MKQKPYYLIGLVFTLLGLVCAALYFFIGFGRPLFGSVCCFDVSCSHFLPSQRVSSI